MKSFLEKRTFVNTYTLSFEHRWYHQRRFCSLFDNTVLSPEYYREKRCYIISSEYYRGKQHREKTNSRSVIAYFSIKIIYSIKFLFNLTQSWPCTKLLFRLTFQQTFYNFPFTFQFCPINPLFFIFSFRTKITFFPTLNCISIPCIFLPFRTEMWSFLILLLLMIYNI